MLEKWHTRQTWYFWYLHRPIEKLCGEVMRKVLRISLVYKIIYLGNTKYKYLELHQHITWLYVKENPLCYDPGGIYQTFIIYTLKYRRCYDLPKYYLTEMKIYDIHRFLWQCDVWMIINLKNVHLQRIFLHLQNIKIT